MEVIIAAAGGAAHLAGVCAAHTVLPVLGVPMESASLKGMDSLLSTVQMPAGIPVGTLAIGAAGSAQRSAAGDRDSGRTAVPSCAKSCASFARSKARKCCGKRFRSDSMRSAISGQPYTGTADRRRRSNYY